MDQLLITNIQRFSLNDGPGIRTTIFCKGCSLMCPWCCNPETISCQIEPFSKDGIEGKYGDWYTVDALYNEIMKDQIYYECEATVDWRQKGFQEDCIKGGVTFSGGECLLQTESLLSLMRMLKKNNIHIVVETALFVPQIALERINDYVDLFYIDMKIMDKDVCKKVLCGDIEVYKRNIKFLVDNKVRFIVRIPMIEEFVMTKKNTEQIIEQLEEIKDSVLKVELLQEHYLGENKYKTLMDAGNIRLRVPKRHIIDMEKYIDFRDKIMEIGLSAEIKYV